MNNFRQSGPGGLRGRQEHFGGRPASDANYGKKKSDGKKPGFAGKGGFKSKDRGGSKGGFSGKRGGFGSGRDGERREVTMHKATCSSCSKPCEVPFRPDGSKPVLCSECFGKNRSDDRNGADRRTERFSHDRPRRTFDAPKSHDHRADFESLKSKVATLEVKLDEIIALLSTAPAKAARVAKTSTEKAPAKKTVVKKAAPKKVVAKKTPAKKVVKKVTKKK